MNTQTMRRLQFAAGAGLPTFLLLLAGAQSVGRVPIGPGTPSGSVGREDPRIAINSLPYTITECGSYFLTDCLTGVAGQSGITINAGNVTLDLNGFALTGVAGSVHGIESMFEDIVIFNGQITNWGADGIHCSGRGLGVSDLRIVANAGNGLFMSGDSIVHDCVLTENGASGIQFLSGEHTLIDTCSATYNGSVGAAINGNGGIIMNSSFSRSIKGITASSGSGWVIIDNTASYNSDRGMDLCAGSLIKGNLIGNNTNADDTGEGIRVRCGGNLVTENLLHQNNTNVKTLSSPDVVVRNYGSRSPLDFDIAGGADGGPVGEASFSTSPWANITD